MNKLLRICKNIYHNTPSYLRFIYWPVEKILWLIGVLELDVWSIYGEEILSKQELAIIYAGSKENKHTIIKLAFNGSYREKYIGKIWLWKISDYIKQLTFNSVLNITELPRFFLKFYRDKESFYTPSWVYGNLDISGDISSIMKSKNIKSDIKRAQKNKLNFER